MYANLVYFHGLCILGIFAKPYVPTIMPFRMGDFRLSDVSPGLPFETKSAAHLDYPTKTIKNNKSSIKCDFYSENWCGYLNLSLRKCIFQSFITTMGA